MPADASLLTDLPIFTALDSGERALLAEGVVERLERMVALLVQNRKG